jgi:hypothetical protein
MGYTDIAIKDKIMEMYPEIAQNEISISLNFSREKKVYIMKLRKDLHELTTHLEKKDIDECMDGIECVHLGVQIGQFSENFKGREKVME